MDSSIKELTTHWICSNIYYLHRVFLTQHTTIHFLFFSPPSAFLTSRKKLGQYYKRKRKDKKQETCEIGHHLITSRMPCSPPLLVVRGSYVVCFEIYFWPLHSSWFATLTGVLTTHQQGLLTQQRHFLLRTPS